MDKERILNYFNQRKQQCALEIMEAETGKRQVLARFDRVIEAPNWTRDGQSLIYNSNGKIYRFSIETLKSQVIDTGTADLCNNDHVLSGDGKYLAVSHSPEPDLLSRIYILPLNGGVPQCITKKGPSYLHGWSPDGRYLSYCAERGGSYDVYIIPAKGGEELRLTNTEGLDDGPEYDPAGEKIWFNSTRSGLMQIWCMNRDGSDQRKMTDIEMNCWFPHVSGDGSKVAYIVYYKEDLKSEEHLPDKKVQIRIMDITGENDHALASIMGGQGTMNVNSWSPDSKYFAFVSY